MKAVFIVVLMLTFSDGSVVTQEGETAPNYIQCLIKIKDWVKEQRVKYKDNNPSTFVIGCVRKQS